MKYTLPILIGITCSSTALTSVPTSIPTAIPTTIPTTFPTSIPTIIPTLVSTNFPTNNNSTRNDTLIFSESDSVKSLSSSTIVMIAIASFFGLGVFLGVSYFVVQNIKLTPYYSDPNKRNIPNDSMSNQNVQDISKIDQTNIAEKTADSIESNKDKWIKLYDSSSGRNYYWNLKTHETSWAIPT